MREKMRMEVKAATDPDNENVAENILVTQESMWFQRPLFLPQQNTNLFLAIRIFFLIWKMFA